MSSSQLFVPRPSRGLAHTLGRGRMRGTVLGRYTRNGGTRIRETCECAGIYGEQSARVLYARSEPFFMASENRKYGL